MRRVLYAPLQRNCDGRQGPDQPALIPLGAELAVPG